MDRRLHVSTVKAFYSTVNKTVLLFLGPSARAVAKKPRCGAQEFPSQPRSHYEAAFADGRLRVEGTAPGAPASLPLQQGMRIRHYTHRHEPPVLDVPIPVRLAAWQAACIACFCSLYHGSMPSTCGCPWCYVTLVALRNVCSRPLSQIRAYASGACGGKYWAWEGDIGQHTHALSYVKSCMPGAAGAGNDKGAGGGRQAAQPPRACVRPVP